jgi:hypothetical protein
VTLRARWVTLRARWVTLRARWVTPRARWVTLRARWVTLRARWVTLRACWATFSQVPQPTRSFAHALQQQQLPGAYDAGDSPERAASSPRPYSQPPESFFDTLQMLSSRAGGGASPSKAAGLVEHGGVGLAAAAIGAALRPAGEEGHVLRHVFHVRGTPPSAPSGRGEVLRLAQSLDHMVAAMGLRAQVSE